MTMYVLPVVGLFGWLEAIADTIISVVKLAGEVVMGLLRLLQIIPTAVSLLTDSIGVLPSILVAFSSVTITVCVIFIIVGREHGGQS